MLKLREGVKIHVGLEAVDMRKSIDGLSALVVDEFSIKPTCGHIFLFFNKAKDKVKILFWDRNGFALYYKRLEKHRFCVPKDLDESRIEITEAQLFGLLAGLDFMLMGEFSEINYSNFY